MMNMKSREKNIKYFIFFIVIGTFFFLMGCRDLCSNFVDTDDMEDMHYRDYLRYEYNWDLFGSRYDHRGCNGPYRDRPYEGFRPCGNCSDSCPHSRYYKNRKPRYREYNRKCPGEYYYKNRRWHDEYSYPGDYWRYRNYPARKARYDNDCGCASGRHMYIWDHDSYLYDDVGFPDEYAVNHYRGGREDINDAYDYDESYYQSLLNYHKRDRYREEYKSEKKETKKEKNKKDKDKEIDEEI